MYDKMDTFNVKQVLTSYLYDETNIILSTVETYTVLKQVK